MNTMNRCLFAPKGLLFGLTALLISTCMVPEVALAQTYARQFPTAAKRGILEVTQPPYVLLNGAQQQLSPGARVRGTTNTTVMSGSLVGQRLLVNYLLNLQGQVHEVWILTDAEAQEKRAGLEPVVNFTFGSDATKPPADDGKTPFNQLPKFGQ
jgi:hypothetical protein